MSSLDRQRVTIMAMKGPSFTQKSRIGKFLARSLRCPILSLDCVLDHLPQPSTNETSNTCHQDLAFDIICDIAHTNISWPILNNVVIDSPLSSESHLHQLTKIALSDDVLDHARVVVVECKPKNTYYWQMEFEKHLEGNPDWALKWYKPKNWDDVKKAINDDYDVDDDSHYLVSKLVLDPYKNIIGNIMEAVKYMMTREEGDGHKVVIFDEWNESRYLSSSKKSIYCEGGEHVIFQRVDYEGNCMACQKQVIIGGEASYVCKDCKLVLHKDCAESFDNNTGETPHSPCAPCKEDGRGFSEECAFCLFEAHVRSRLRPTVVKDLNVDKHLLSVVLPPVGMPRPDYLCKACGEYGSFGTYYCRICSVGCHYECHTRPRRVIQEHGGHYHIMSLMFSSKPDQEEYMCDECLEKRDPELWHYSCEECVFVVHLRCVHKTSYLAPIV